LEGTRLLRLTFILLVLASVGSGAEFTTAASCETLGVSAVGSTSCHTEGTYTGPSSILAPFQFATAAITENSFTVGGNTLTVREQSTSYVSPLSEATLYDALSAILFTPGPVRSGFITGFLDEGTFINGGGASFRVSYPGYVFSGPFGSGAPPIPITLGQLFPLSVITQTQDTSNDQTNATVMTDLQLHLNLFEADGVTPANIFEVAVPEPASLGLMLASVIGTFLFRFCTNPTTRHPAVRIPASLAIAPRPPAPCAPYAGCFLGSTGSTGFFKRPSNS
jgi:hypothetical protein